MCLKDVFFIFNTLKIEAVRRETSSFYFSLYFVKCFCQVKHAMETATIKIFFIDQELLQGDIKRNLNFSLKLSLNSMNYYLEVIMKLSNGVNELTF